MEASAHVGDFIYLFIDSTSLSVTVKMYCEIQLPWIKRFQSYSSWGKKKIYFVPKSIHFIYKRGSHTKYTSTDSPVLFKKLQVYIEIKYCKEFA